MLRSAVLTLTLIVIASWGSPRQGCRDAGSSLTHLPYFPKRDMRSTVALRPQRAITPLPDSISVPTTGREVAIDRDLMSATFSNPVPSDQASVARGELKFQRTCVPCHGKTLVGNGPVAAKFVPPPDLMGETQRSRPDGFIYYYIRHGGAVMPSYGAQVTAEEAYDLINYIRHMQRTNPR
jgi:mono/diheme cytochrome c family protein